MPLDILKNRNHVPLRSLGFFAVWWIETFVVHGAGGAYGEQIILPEEYARFVIDCYALDKNGRRIYNSAFFSRPKGCNKSELGAMLCLFEALAPCRFQKWANGGERYELFGEVYVYDKGEPIGHNIMTPFIRIMATEENQAGNVYNTVLSNLKEGKLSNLKAKGLDAGLTRILLPAPYGGEIRASTSGAASKDGGKETFAVFDETHLYNTNELREMYATVVRNLPKRGKDAEPWFLETTTMYATGENSVAEATFNYAQDVKAGIIKNNKLYMNHRFADIQPEDMGSEQKLKNALKEAYGDAVEWVDTNSIYDTILDPRNSITSSFRYYLNVPTASEISWLTYDTLKPKFTQNVLQNGDTITLGFDGALANDSTVLVACRVSDGLLEVIYSEECPDTKAREDWHVNQLAFDRAVKESYERFNVVGFYADPPYWQDWVSRWETTYSKVTKIKISQKKPFSYWTNKHTTMMGAIERFTTGVLSPKGQLSINQKKSGIIIRHITNAVRKDYKDGFVLTKDRKGSMRKIDGAIASVLAYEARAEAYSKGLHKTANNTIQHINYG